MVEITGGFGATGSLLSAAIAQLMNNPGKTTAAIQSKVFMSPRLPSLLSAVSHSSDRTGAGQHHPRRFQANDSVGRASLPARIVGNLMDRRPTDLYPNRTVLCLADQHRLAGRDARPTSGFEAAPAHPNCILPAKTFLTSRRPPSTNTTPRSNGRAATSRRAQVTPPALAIPPNCRFARIPCAPQNRSPAEHPFDPA